MEILSGLIADIYGILDSNYLLHIRIVCTQLQIRRRHWSSFQMCPRRNPKSFHSRHLVCTNLQQHTSRNCLHRNQQIDHYILKRSPKNETISCFCRGIILSVRPQSKSISFLLLPSREGFSGNCL